GLAPPPERLPGALVERLPGAAVVGPLEPPGGGIRARARGGGEGEEAGLLRLAQLRQVNHDLRGVELLLGAGVVIAQRIGGIGGEQVPQRLRPLTRPARRRRDPAPPPR